jgi:hypothetical protein
MRTTRSRRSARDMVVTWAASAGGIVVHCLHIPNAFGVILSECVSLDMMLELVRVLRLWWE